MERFQNDDVISQDIDNQDYNDENFNYNNIKNSNIIEKRNNQFSHFQKKFQENKRDNENEIINKKSSFLEKPIIPERTISNYYSNEFLTNAILKSENFELPFHKIILCSASDFLNNYFKLNPDITQKSVVDLPQILKSSLSQGNKKECLDKIFKYCYYNQDIKSIESDITQANCFTFLELAHCLQIKSLCSNLEKIIIKNFLKDENMIKISEESNNFELEELRKECSNKIKNNLGNIQNKAKELTELKYETFKDIISSDALDVEQEKDVVDLVIEYLKSRRKIPEEEKEIKNLENQENNENQEENKENNEENKNNEEPPQNQENENIENEENNKENPYNNWKKHLDKLEKNSKKKRLSPEEEKILVLCIRFSYLSHADLISLTNEPIMQNFKDLILQGLSARLDTYENTNEKKTIINLTPRHYLRGQQISNNYKRNNVKNNDCSEINNEIKSDNNMENLKDIGLGKSNQFNKFNDQRNFSHSQPIIQKNNNLNERDSNINNYIKDEMELPSYYDENNLNNSNSNYLGHEILNIDEINSKKRKMAVMGKSSLGPYPPQDPRISQNFFRSQRIMSNYNPIFKYTYDFDENGALYYLGTKGKKYQYRNPHELNLVTAFASSLSKGQISDFVGRNLVNLRTENEENSFFGVDLGENRTLSPTAYSLRNRNSSTHVMLCWNLEASNDKIHFEILDTRIFSNVENPQVHQRLERERNLLKEPGCTSTWGISKKIKEKFPDGFRYFLIKQIDKNSNGNYNLTNSGFELYGQGKGRGWIFN